jgi:hypothetical protein
MAGDASFGSCTFDIIFPDMGDDTEAVVTFQHVPYSNVTYADSAGVKENPQDLKLYFDVESDYYALKGAVDSIATLSYVAGTYPNMYLQSLKRTQRYPGGQTFADAVFVAVTPG